MMEESSRTLTLLHLRKTYSEYCKVPMNGSEKDEKKFDRILPLFVKVTTMYRSEEISEHFKELYPFSGHLSRILVQEIRLRASNESTENAALSILRFLLPDSADSRGWNLLNSVGYVVSTGQAGVIDAVCKAALPSTLVKTLYLFFDLPPSKMFSESLKSKVYPSFLNLMDKLCSQKTVGEELARKDDLFLLFAGSSCICPHENSMWRKAAAQLLLSLMSKALSPLLVKYIHGKGCLQHFLNIISGAEDRLLLRDQVEMVITLLCILRDSARLTNTLVNDFTQSRGFTLLKDFVLKNEKESESIRGVLLMLMSFCFSGTTVLQPVPPSEFVAMQSFVLPVPSSDGSSVRNMEAFKVLFHLLLQTGADPVCEIILDIIHNVYESDSANYFITDKECPLSQMIEQMPRRSLRTQRKVLELLEYVVFQLNHVACKELIAISVLLKTQISVGNLECCVLSIQSAFRILSADAVLKDAFREVGLVETFTWIILHFIPIVQDHELTDAESRAALLSTDILSLLVKNNHSNARVFRECAGSKALVDLMHCSNSEWRSSALQLVKQLLIQPHSEEQFTALLHVLHSSSPCNLRLNTVVLKTLLCILRESHKVRIMFRRVGGYLCLMSMLLSFEGELSANSRSEAIRSKAQSSSVVDADSIAANTGKQNMYEVNEVLEFIELIFKLITLSMRYEPSNARYFSAEIKWESLCTSLRLLGAFDENKLVVDTVDPIWRCERSEVQDKVAACQRVFQQDELTNDIPDNMPNSIYCACLLLRLLFNLSIDAYEKCKSDVVWPTVGSLTSLDDSTSSAVTLNSTVVHPGALITMLQLLPGISSDEAEWNAAAQFHCAVVIKSLIRSERNQQIMCQVDMARTVLTVGEHVFRSSKHLLLAPFYYVFERLSCQAIHPKDLRLFLRLDYPLCCRNLCECEGEEPINDDEGGPLPVARVKSLVSMMTPRDHRLAQAPSFVEFDMSIEGFACLLIPSLAPLSSDRSGVGNGERVFPPLSGLSITMWLNVDQFSDKRLDPHPIRLLSVFRCFSGFRKKNERDPTEASQLTCLSVQLSCIDHSLLISTLESETAGNDLEKEEQLSDENFVRVALADTVVTHQWTHIAVVLTRAVLKHSQVSVYINGVLRCSQKLHYIVQNVGGAATHLAQTSGIHGIIGTPPMYRSPSRLLFKIASFYVLEEALSPEAVNAVYRLEPHYVGNFQMAGMDGAALIPEERVCISLSAAAVMELTVARICSMYSQADGSLIASYLGLSAHDRSTPLRVLSNTIAHAPGPARAFGAVVIGYLGMRVFAPRPVTRILESVGGVSCLLGLVAMAADSQGLYASLKALVSAIRSDRNIANRMYTTRSYQTLAVLLEEKSCLLNSHILHLILSLVGTLDTSRETTTIPSLQTFEDLLCDLDVWKSSSEDLNRLLYEHFYELITDQQRSNLSILRRSSLPCRVLIRLLDMPENIHAVNDVVFNLLGAIVQPPCDANSLLKIGQMVAATLPISVNEHSVNGFPLSVLDLQAYVLSSRLITDTDRAIYMVYIRNRILNIIANSLAHSTPNNNVQMCEQIAKVLGFDWVLTFFSPNLHVGTIDVAFRILLFLLNHPHLLQRFREGSTNGGWLTDADSVVRNRAAVLLGFSVSAHGGSVGAQIDINPEMSNCGGFTALEHLLSSHAEKPQCYMAMLSVLFGQPVPNIKLGTDFSLDLVWSNIFGLSLSSSVTEAISTATICPDALIPLLSMVRATLHDGKETDPDDNWRQRYPCTVIQILSFLYQNSSELFSICHTEEFIVLLFTVLIPFEITSVNTNIEKSTQSTDSTLVIERVLRNPCGRSILDLIKRILCDDVYLSHDARTDNTLDTLIENIPDNGVSRRFQSIVLSEIIVVCMDNMIATDILLEGSLTSMLLLTNPSPPASSTNTNFVYFASRIVDCLWMGVYTKEPTTVLDFLFKAVLLGRRKESRASITESLMPSLSRTILYLLSRPIDSPKVQSSILDTLSGILNNRSIVFAPSFNDPVFFGAFTHLIFMLSITPDIFPEDGHSCQLDRSSAQVALCAAEVWRELCNFKRHTLEEVFKRVFVNELNAARALLSNVASLHWQTFVDSQITCSSTRNIAQIQQQIQQRITKVASGFQRLASRKGLSSSSSSPSISMWRQTDISAEVVQMWVRVHTSLIRELMRIQCTRYHEWHAHVRKWCLAEWHVLESELTRERGLWGPEEGSVLDKFCLDTTESPCRIRRKLIPNPAFYHQYPYRPHLDHPEYKALRTKFAVSRDSKIYYEVMKKRRSKTMDSRIVDNSTSMESPSDDRAELLFTDLQEVNASMIRRVSVKNANDAKEKLAVKNSSEPSQEKAELDDDEDGVDTNGEEGEDANSTAEPNLGLSVPGREGADVTIGDRSEAVATGAKEQKEKKGPDNQTLLRLLEQGEQLQSMFRCARIQGLDTSEGLLLFGRDHYYVVDGFTLLKTREIRDLDFLPQQLHDPIVPYMACGVARPTRCLRLCSKFSYEDIREVHKRRYLLQPIAIEVFSADGRNYLLAFPKKMRNRVYQKLISMAKGLMDSGSESVSGQRASMSIEQNSRVSLLSSLIGQQSVTQRWVNGEISNFQYLMHLNTIAGRSYNDLSQYPVFPWVLRDYESESLDLTNPSAFRDLSRPMGAQDPERLQQFLKRYKEWDDPTGETPPYMYGTHYSSAMIVVSYLVRLEPFTQQFLKLQGGHFDLADRMFHSVRDAWLSASRKNMADVKELIPEFYSLPEMFINANHFDFGVKQNGVVLDDVVLPPWAKGDAREFVRIHREALECDYVSANLHNWIDLIFGYRQRGSAAVESYNLFHHLFYEGNVDYESIDDPLTRNATIGFINNFGQIPSQLFRKPHPQKKTVLSDNDSHCTRSGVATARLFFHSLDTLKVPQEPYKELKSAVGSLLAIDKGGVIALEANRILISSTNYLAWGFPDRSVRIGVVDSDKSQCIYEQCENAEMTCFACEDGRTLFSGSTTGTISVWNMSSKWPRLQPRRTLEAHVEAVTALVVCSPHTLLLSASRDSTVILWHLSALTFIRQLRPHPSAVTALAINENNGDIVTAASTMLFVWTINGQILSAVNTEDVSPFGQTSHIILCVAFSTMNEWDIKNVIMCGGSDGIVRLYSMVLEECGSPRRDMPTKSTSHPKSAHSTAVGLQQIFERQRQKLKAASISVGSFETVSRDSRGGSPEFPGTPNLESDSCGSPSWINGSLEPGVWKMGTPASTDDQQQHWRRVLVLRNTLTMHTAFARKDNTRPAPITALTASRDNKSLFVGDGVGRVWHWQMGEESGVRADHWIQDPSRNECTQCQQRFSLAERRHHCRNCGHIFCSRCSRFESDIAHMKISKPVRVCQNCYLRLKAQTSG